MINLRGTTDSLEVVTGSAVTVDVLAAWVDLVDAATTASPNATPTAITTATTTTIVAAAGTATTTRNVKMLNIRNKHATSSVAVTVQVNRSATLYELFKVTLLAQEMLTYVEGQGWKLLDATGAVKIASSGTGRWLKTTVLTGGTTFLTGPATTSIFVRLVGGGGGGGGCTSVASAAGAAGGGGAGGYAEKTFTVTPNTNYTYGIGSGGTGVSGAGGNNGIGSSFTVGGVTVSALPGSGAPVATAATTLTARAGGLGAGLSTGGDVNGAGQCGDPGVVLIVATPIVCSGQGGSGPFGAGGLGRVAVGNGNVAAAFGGGGGGAATGASAVRTGGNGTQGVIIVDEYA